MTPRFPTPTRASLAASLCLAWAVACDRGDEPKAAEPPAPAPTTAAPTPAPVVVPSVLDGVVTTAIQPPPEGGSTYRVDAYVGAIIVEHLRRDPQPFTSWRSDGSDPSRPEAGYRVGPLRPDDVWTRLGLREGDIVNALNGVPITREGWAGEVLSRGENQVNVTLFREDVSIVLSYRMMGAMAWNGLRTELVPPTEVAVAEPEEGDDGSSPEQPTDVDPTRSSGADTPASGGSAGAGTPSSGGSGRPSSGAGGSGSGSRPSSGGSSSAGGSGSGSSTRPSSGGGSTRPAVARCTSDTQCTLDKATYDAIVRSPSKIESQARIVPAIANDVHSGYKLKSVTSGSAIDQLGFRAGDKITHVNGLDLTNEIEAMQLYMGLSSTRRFRVRYVRGGSTRNKTIDVV